MWWILLSDYNVLIPKRIYFRNFLHFRRRFYWVFVLMNGHFLWNRIDQVHNLWFVLKRVSQRQPQLTVLIVQINLHDRSIIVQQHLAVSSLAFVGTKLTFNKFELLCRRILHHMLFLFIKAIGFIRFINARASRPANRWKRSFST